MVSFFSVVILKKIVEKWQRIYTILCGKIFFVGLVVLIVIFRTVESECRYLLVVLVNLG